MTRGGEDVEAERAALGDPHVLLRDGRELAPEPVEALAVETACRGLEPRRVYEVRGADLRHPHGQVGMLAHDRPGCTCVVEVDMGEEQMPDLPQLQASLAEPLLEPRQRRRRPAVEERRAVARLEHVHADRVLEPEELEIDRLVH